MYSTDFEISLRNDSLGPCCSMQSMLAYHGDSEAPPIPNLPPSRYCKLLRPRKGNQQPLVVKWMIDSMANAVHSYQGTLHNAPKPPLPSFASEQPKDNHNYRT